MQDLRQQNLQRQQQAVFDVLVIGGGINGAVSAASLSARGLSTALIDANDFAGFTSQHSSNLVWGGIKYMENAEFGLVAKLCKSRNELMRSYPSTIKEIRFLTPVRRGSRMHPLFLWAGTWLYWLLGRGKTRPPKWFGTERLGDVEPVIDRTDCRAGVEYSDAYLHDNDSRFVFGFIHRAVKHGCAAVNYAEAIGAEHNPGDGWTVRIRDNISQNDYSVRTKVVINACGAFVDQLNREFGLTTEHRHVYSKGVHLIVPRLTEHHHVLTFFADDGRLFFAIPMGNRTCIGTTDTRVDETETEVTAEDRSFILNNINAHIRRSSPLTETDIISERCGIRPLVTTANSAGDADFLNLSRKHVIECNQACRNISIFGGKLTDCLNIGEEIHRLVEKLDVKGPKHPSQWYGEPESEISERYLARTKALGLDQNLAEDTGESLSTRLWRRYGEDAFELIDELARDPDLATPVIPGTGIRRCEIDYLKRHEMIVKLEDFLRRRSKLELLLGQDMLKHEAALVHICRHLFGAEAEKQFREYISGFKDWGQS